MDGSSAPGTRPAPDRRPLALLIVVALGMVTIGLAGLILHPARAPLGVPFPSEPALACRPPASAEKGGGTLAFGWQVAVEIDRPMGSAVLFVSGPDTLLCFVSRSPDDTLGSVSSGIGGHRGDNRSGLTLDGGMSNASQEPDILVGRVPRGTATVRVGVGTGAVEQAAVANGYYLAWLAVPAVPVRIDALDPSGRPLGRLEDPSGIRIPS